MTPIIINAWVLVNMNIHFMSGVACFHDLMLRLLFLGDLWCYIPGVRFLVVVAIVIFRSVVVFFSSLGVVRLCLILMWMLMWCFFMRVLVGGWLLVLMAKLSTRCQLYLMQILHHLNLLMTTSTSVTKILAGHPFRIVLAPKHLSTAIMLTTFLKSVFFWLWNLLDVILIILS